MAKKIVITTNRTTDLQLEYIKEKIGAISNAEAVRYALTLAYEKAQPPAYVRAKLGDDTKSKALSRIAEKKEKEQAERELINAEGEMICEALNGTVIVNGQDKGCKYTVVERFRNGAVQEFEQVKLFGQLTDETVKNQFTGEWTKEDITRYKEEKSWK